ncbi:FtsX-like permease family protein [Paenibacillus sp. YPG26]|uniref:ABC transporter permease n=1 Tax=Paenibacillus sp. YPG26 TaxID=2878915 RepID=UPI00203FD1B1|nr:FtsX-like permease family protein [Paenibacillus sp. YPG26]USB33530.1 FtsX-like permease family protein [Paenibacillus sp. YPG26]
MKLFLKLLRDTRQSIGQFIALVMVIAVGAFFYAGLVTYSDRLSAYSEVYFREHNLSDLNISYTQISREDTAGLSTIKGIHKIEGRYTFDATQVSEDAKASLTIHSIPANNTINTPALIQGRIPLHKNEILLDSHYAQAHDYQVEDTISVTTDGKSLKFTISGLGENVEHAKKNETQDHHAYGVAYIAEEALPEILGSLQYNEVMIDADEGYNIDNLAQSIEARSDPLTYLTQVSKERSFSYSKIQETIFNNGLMSKVIPFVLFVISAIILFLTMSRIIDSQRNQIGIMKALGVKNRTIMLHYMGFPVMASVIGSIIGCAVAASVFIPLVTASSARAYSLPGLEFSLSAFSLFPPLIFSSACGLLSCYLSGRVIFKERAADAMRPRPLRQMRQLYIERIPGIWNRISYSYKLILRNIFLNKHKTVASSIGVMISTVLLITAFGTQTALMQVANQIEKVHTYDLRVDYTAGTFPDSAALPSGIRFSYDSSTLPVEFIQQDEQESATLVVTPSENKLIHFFDDNNNRIQLENNGVLVPKSYADQYRIAEGDTIRLRFTSPPLRNKTVDMPVLGISTQYSNPVFYCTPAYLEAMGILYNPTSLVVEAASPEELSSLRSFFEQDPRVDALADKDDLKKSARYIVQQNSFVFILFIICAVILSFGAIFTISSINIYERNRELATLKVLGYPRNKIHRLIFLENIILTTLAVIIAIPASGYVYSLVVKALSSTHQQIPGTLGISSLVLSVILAYLLTILANLLLRRKVTRINMTESLKSVE